VNSNEVNSNEVNSNEVNSNEVNSNEVNEVNCKKAITKINANSLPIVSGRKVITKNKLTATIMDYDPIHIRKQLKKINPYYREIDDPKHNDLRMHEYWDLYQTLLADYDRSTDDKLHRIKIKEIEGKSFMFDGSISLLHDEKTNKIQFLIHQGFVRITNDYNRVYRSIKKLVKRRFFC
jgi:hypothetical protein